MQVHGAFSVHPRLCPIRRMYYDAFGHPRQTIMKSFWPARAAFVPASTWRSKAWSWRSSSTARRSTSITRSSTTSTWSRRFRDEGRGLRRHNSKKCPRAPCCSIRPTAYRPRSGELADERRQLRTIDATCPLVTKVHLEAIRYARGGLHDRLDRPRGARRSDRHDGRGPRGDRCWSKRPKTSTGWRSPTRQSWPI